MSTATLTGKSKAVDQVISVLSGKSDKPIYDIAHEFLQNESPSWLSDAESVDLTASSRAVDRNRNSAREKIIKTFFAYIDFPTLFRNVANSLLIETWAVRSNTWNLWISENELEDFRVADLIKAGIMPEPTLVKEGQEYERHQSLFGERASAQLKTYGNITNVPRSQLFGEERGALGTIINSIAAAYDRKIGNDVYGLLKSNPVSFEDREIFHADHNNQVVLTSDFAKDLGNALEAMYSQKYRFSESEEELLTVQPRFVLVSPSYSTEASKIVGDYNAAIEDSQKLTVIIEPRLAGYSGWFLAAEKRYSSIGLFKLKGSNAPNIITKEIHKVDGMDIKYRWDIDVAPVDYRGLVRVQ